MEQIFAYLDGWLNNGIYTFFTEAFAYFIEASILGYLKLVNIAIPFAWGVAKTIIEDLNISAMMNSAYDDLPSMSRAILVACRVPEAVNFAMSAFATKFVLKFIPGL